MPKPLRDADYRTLSDFRYALRSFRAFSERAAAAAGLKPQQHQALLAIRAAPGATMLIGKLAERLMLKPHSATELVDRLVGAGLIERVSGADRRQAWLVLTPRAATILEELTDAHRAELKRLRPMLQDLLDQI